MNYSSSSFGHTDTGFSPRRFGRKAALLLGFAALFPVSLLRAVDSEADFNNFTDLTAAGNYSVSAGTFSPTAGSTYDVVLGLGNSGGTSSYSNPALTANGANLVFGTLNDLDTADTLTINSTAAQTITLSSAANGVAGSSAGDLIYLAANTNLTFGSNEELILSGSGNNIDIGAGATLTVSKGLNPSTGGNSSTLTYINKTGSGTLVINGNSLSPTAIAGYNDGINLKQGTLDLNTNGIDASHGSLILSGGTVDTTVSGASQTYSVRSIALGGTSYLSSASFAFGDTKSLILSEGAGSISDFAQTLTITLNGSNAAYNPTFTQGITNAGFSGTLGSSSGTTFTVNNASGAASHTLNLGGYILYSSGGTLGTAAFNDTFNGTANINITGAVTDNETGGAKQGVTYSGTGTLILGGTNTYTNGTLVQSGTVSVTGGSLGTGTGTGTTGDGTSGTGTGTVTVGNGTTTTAAYLTGTGYISGNVTTISTGGASSNIAHIAPGTVGTVGTLHLGVWGGSSGSYALGTPSLSLGNGSALDFDLSSAATTAGGTTNDLISMTGGTLTLGSNLVLNVTASTVNAPLLGTSTTNDYILISGFTGGTAGLVSNFGTTTGVGTDVANYFINSAGTALEVYFTAGVATSGNLYFNGANSGNLNTASTYNIDASSGTASGTTPVAATNVFFSANQNSNTSAILNSALTVNSLNFGAGTGTNTGITVSGSNAVTIEATNANSNTAGNGITVASGSDTISAPVILGGSQTFTTTTSGSKLTISGQISQAATSQLTFAGNGTTVLTNNNTYTGGSAITGGTVYANNGGGASYTAPSSAHTPTGLGTGSALGSGPVSISTGAKLAGSGTVAGTVTVNGTLASGDATRQSASSPYTVTGTGLTLNSGVTVNAGSTLQFTLGAGVASSFASPNTDSTYMSLTSNALTEFNFATSGAAVNINLVDLTPDSNGLGLNLNSNNPYLLVQTGANSNFNLVTNNGYDQNGYVIGTSSNGGTTVDTSAFAFSVNDINGNPISYYSSAGGRVGLYLYNGDLEVIPEPSTWALMIGGLGLLVLLQRRRKFSHWGTNRS